ncbi:hypothetical protein BGZ99_000009 [Dissophora globulifera]|uniref:Mis6-domain-containing protein n=1 Tax=Dissophora globulifera TaxID=979702 RepID=A0A9P6RXK2_9FUNG|nr:hypothetical protein BGZ99_000009 [Dissophora globulifera]
MEEDRDALSADAQTDVAQLTLEEADDTIQNCLERMDRNAGVRGGKPALLRALSTLEPIIQHFGVSPDDLTIMMDVILKGKADETTTKRLVKLLLPRQHVPEMCAVKVLGSLGKQHPGLQSQVLLLKWIIIVYDIFDSRSKLQQLYGVAFHYLGYETLRMDLQTNVGREPALEGLLHIFKSYYPDLILTPLPLSNATIFKCPDQNLSERVLEIQDRWSHLAEQHHILSLNGSKEPIIRAKRQKLSHSTIPDAFSIYRSTGNEKHLPLAQITSLDSLIQHIDTLALPDQLASILSNRLLQHVLCLQTSHSIIERISYWLGQELMDLWYWQGKTDATRARFSTILLKVVEVTTMIKDLLPVMENFLIPYLRIWNGVDYRKEIFTLLTYLRPRGFEELFTHFLKPLHGLFYFMGPVWKGELLLCYTRLLQRWAQFKWTDYLELGKDPRLSKEGLEGLRRLFSKLAPNVDYMETIRAFIGHVGSISSVAMEMENDHVAVQHGVLSFYDFTSTFTMTYRVPLAVIIPESAIVYRCFLSDAGMALSRICGIVYQYKKSFEAFELDQQLQYDMLVQSQLSSQLMAEGDIPPPPPADIPGYSRDYVILFNSFVMDICNFLWRNRAFNKADKNARGFLVDQYVLAMKPSTVFNSVLRGFPPDLY